MLTAHDEDAEKADGERDFFVAREGAGVQQAKVLARATDARAEVLAAAGLVVRAEEVGLRAGDLPAVALGGFAGASLPEARACLRAADAVWEREVARRAHVAAARLAMGREGGGGGDCSSGN